MRDFDQSLKVSTRMPAHFLISIRGARATSPSRRPTAPSLLASLTALAVLLVPHLALAQRAAPTDQQSLAADLHETVVRIPVTVTLLDGSKRSGQMIVTHFRPDGPGPFPLVVINHGRASSAAARATPERFRMLGVARYWLRRGFAVVVPTRLGYGATGTEPDTESSGNTCNVRNYQPMAEAAAHQIRTAVNFAVTLPFVDKSRIVLMGQSVGGLATTTAVSKGIPGVIAAINSAGGSGGNPAERPGKPCRPDRIGDVFAAAGKSARAPMLWLYSQNDRYWGPDHPLTWHARYQKTGGKAEFVMLPANGEDGHKQLDHLALWRPHVDRFIARLGFAIPRAASDVVPSGFAAIEDIDKVPVRDPEKRKEHYPKFLALDLPRAFAISPGGAFAYRSGADALEKALQRCQEIAKTACKPYAIDDVVVWGK